MTKPEALKILELLSALEALGMMRDKAMPDYILEDLEIVINILRRDVLA